MSRTPQSIQVDIAKGAFNPHQYLTNLSMAAYQQQGLWVAKTIFPTVPVQLQTGYYYEWSTADLARDNVQRKPENGKVNPAIVSHTEQMYSCVVDQVIRGLDQITTLNYTRAGLPGSVDPRRSITKFIAEQMNMHQDIVFANSYFKPGVWANEWTGGTTEDHATKTFYKFTESNSDPLVLFDELIKEITLKGRRRPNRLALGVDAWLGLKHNPAILDRIRGGATAGNPAVITEQLVASLLGIEKVVVLQSTYNTARFGQNDGKPNLEFICDPTSALLCYATSAPAIDEPSAGYMFAWDMLGNGQYFPTLQYEGEGGTHTEFIEGLMAYDMKKTSDDLAIFLKSCV